MSQCAALTAAATGTPPPPKLQDLDLSVAALVRDGLAAEPLALILEPSPGVRFGEGLWN
jgi:hypothetical protein